MLRLAGLKPEFAAPCGGLLLRNHCLVLQLVDSVIS